MSLWVPQLFLSIADTLLESELDKQVQNAGSDTSQRQLLEREVDSLKQQVTDAQAIVHQNCDREHLDMANPCIPTNHSLVDGVPVVKVGDGTDKIPQHVPVFFPGGEIKFYDPREATVLMRAYTASFLAWQQAATPNSQVMRHEMPSARATRRLLNRAKREKEKGAKK